jgi:hypothetical protein
MHESADRKVREKKSIEPLLDQLRRLAAQCRLSAAQVSLELVDDGLDLPSIVVERRQVFCRSLRVVTPRLEFWGLPEAQRVPPWEWRKGKRAGRSTTEPPPGRNFTCGAKRYCGEMESCAEARFYLEECGLARLDGDGDGVPCESICR